MNTTTSQLNLSRNTPIDTSRIMPSAWIVGAKDADEFAQFVSELRAVFEHYPTMKFVTEPLPDIEHLRRSDADKDMINEVRKPFRVEGATYVMARMDFCFDDDGAKFDYLCEFTEMGHLRMVYVLNQIGNLEYFEHMAEYVFSRKGGETLRSFALSLR